MIELIINDVLKVSWQYTPFAIVTGAMIMVVLCVFQSIVSNRSLGKTIVCYGMKFTVIYIFYVYLFTVVAITYLSRVPGVLYGVNLKVFETLWQNINDTLCFIENIILFIPFGFLLPLIWNKFFNIFLCIGAGLSFSLAIELSQYYTKRGFFQTDDIITNLFGIMIGFGTICGCRWILTNIRAISNLKEEQE